ncbi:hypothetical protein O1L60_04205 [Streptomyces diastatochromogenes]|nr:hypothetical protein [Streptomyces diastatochromogenes]
MTRIPSASGDSIGSPSAADAAIDALTTYASRYAELTARADKAARQARHGIGWPDCIAVERKIEAERHREQTEAFAELLPHTALLIGRARAALLFQPPARHLAGWGLLVDDLEVAADLARDRLARQTGDGTAVLRHCQVTWAERARFLKDLAVQDAPPLPGPELPPAEEARWTAHAKDVRHRHMMYLYEFRYDAAGRQLTVVGVPDLDDPIDDCALIVAGDVDSPTMRVLGRYDTYDQALAALPPPVQPGVLHPRGRFPQGAGAIPALADLIEDVAGATHSQTVAEVLGHVASNGTGPCHLSQLSDLLGECADFALATETVAGRDLSVRLRELTVQTDLLDHQLRQALFAFEDTVAVLPRTAPRGPGTSSPRPRCGPPRRPRPPRPRCPASRAASNSSGPRANLRLLPESPRLLAPGRTPSRPTARDLPGRSGHTPRPAPAGRHPDRPDTQRHGRRLPGPVGHRRRRVADDGQHARRRLRAGRQRHPAGEGRLMDRHGQTRVSAPAAVIASGSLLALPVIGPGGSRWAIGAAVALAGLATPPLESGLRSLWPSVVTDPGQRKVIQALDTGSQGLMYVTGPLLATWLAATFGADTALTAASALGLFGTAAVLTSRPSRTWRPHREETVGITGPAKRQRLASGGMVLVCTGLAALGVSLGGLGVWAAALAETHLTAWLTGVLPAAFSTGSFLGGLLFARLPAAPHPPPNSAARQRCSLPGGWGC